MTIGTDEQGHLWLLNLEACKILAVTGDPTRAFEFGRYVAAELALNPWSRLVAVDLLDFAPELTGVGGLWFDHHTADDTDFLERLAKELDDTYALSTDDPELLHAVLTPATHASSDPLRRVLDLVGTHPGRTGAALLLLAGSGEPGSTEVHLDAHGRLHATDLGLNLQAVGLNVQEASLCAALAEITRDADGTTPMPVDETAETGWPPHADLAGALRDHLTQPRPEGPAGQQSLLPHSAEEYTGVAATTLADVETLAPVVPEQTRALVEDADPGLDDDVAAWFDPEARVPKLTLLGPVTGRAHGDPRAVSARKPFYVELLSYIALHPEGVTSHQVANALNLTVERVRTDVGIVRRWLGVDSRTGQQHLPPADKTRAFQANQQYAYQVDGVLVDLDLFRRLRARGQARGAAGITDLQTALRLVSGQPFTQLRSDGWSWLLDDGQRLYDITEAAIVDVAHIVVTRALAEGDLELARSAAETACSAVPYDEVARLDLIAVIEAEGHHELAERMRNDDICNRSDDGRAPIDLANRTHHILGASRARDASRKMAERHQARSTR